MKELKFNLKYLLNRKELYLAFIIVMWIHLVYLFTQFQPGLNGMLYPSLEERAILHTIFMNNGSLMYILFYLIIPLACNMIFADTSWKDLYENTGNTLYPRIDMKRSIKIRWMLSLVVTFIIVFLGFMLSYMVLISVFKDGYVAIGHGSPAFNIDIYPALLKELMIENPFLYTTLEYARISLIISFLSGFGYSISFFIKNKIFVYFSVLALQIGHDVILLGAYNVYLSILHSGTQIPEHIIRFGEGAYAKQFNTLYYLTPAIYCLIFTFLLALVPLLLALRKKDYI